MHYITRRERELKKINIVINNIILSTIEAKLFHDARNVVPSRNPTINIAKMNRI